MKGMVILNESLVASYRLEHNNKPFEYHSHQEYEVYIFHTGSCRYLIKNQIYDLEPGDVLLMDGMTLHKPNVKSHTEYVRSVVHFSPHWLKGLLEELGSLYLLDAFKELQHCLIRTKENKELERLEEIICRLNDIRKSPGLLDQHKETEIKVLLLQMLISVHCLAQMADIKPLNEKTGKTEHAENIAKYIQQNYMEKINLEVIAEELSLSKSYISHLFKEMTGFTVMEYVMACRLTQVKYLLEIEPDKSIKDIANESGFDSASHFSRYFRDRERMTAREYRNKRLALYESADNRAFD